MDEPAVPSTKLWCDHCNRLVAADEVKSDDDQVPHCPHCGAAIGDDADAARGNADAKEESEEGPPKAPWHFKVLLVGTVLYLIYRLIWFIMWLTHHA